MNMYDMGQKSDQPNSINRTPALFRLNSMSMNIEKTLLVVQCDNPACLHIWNYTGKSRFFVSCPFCRRNVNLRKQEGVRSQILADQAPMHPSTTLTPEGVERG